MAGSSYFEIKFSPNKFKEEEEELPVLVLAPFNKVPKIHFKDVQVSSAVKKSFLIRNPTHRVAQVQFVGFPEPERRLTFSTIQVVLQPGEQNTVDVTWSPVEVEAWSINVGVVTNCTCQLDVAIICNSVKKTLRTKYAKLQAKKEVKNKSWSSKLAMHGISKTDVRNSKKRLLLNQTIKQQISFAIQEKTCKSRLPVFSASKVINRRETFLVSPGIQDCRNMVSKDNPCQSEPVSENPNHDVLHDDVKYAEVCHSERAVSSLRTTQNTCFTDGNCDVQTFSQRLKIPSDFNIEDRESHNSLCHQKYRTKIPSFPWEGTHTEKFQLSTDRWKCDVEEPCIEVHSESEEFSGSPNKTRNVSGETYFVESSPHSVSDILDIDNRVQRPRTMDSDLDLPKELDPPVNSGCIQSTKPSSCISDFLSVLQFSPLAASVKDETLQKYVSSDTNMKMKEEHLDAYYNTTTKDTSYPYLPSSCISDSCTSKTAELSDSFEGQVLDNGTGINMNDSDFNISPLKPWELAQVKQPHCSESSFSFSECDNLKTWYINSEATRTPSSRQKLKEITHITNLSSLKKRVFSDSEVLTPLKGDGLDLDPSKQANCPKFMKSSLAFESPCTSFNSNSRMKRTFVMDISPPKRYLKENLQTDSTKKCSSKVLDMKKKTISSVNKVKSETILRTKSSLRIPIKKLILTSAKKLDNKPVKLYSPDKIISGIINPKVTVVNPFLNRSVYYDQQWFDNREKEYVKWLNYILTPHKQLSSHEELPKVNMAVIWERSCKLEVGPAPSREAVSSLYHTNRRLESLRKSACGLFCTPDVAKVLSKVVLQIEKQILSVRADKDIHLDIGLKQEVIQLLLCYNPLWLRIGLEAIYGRTIPLESNSDVFGLVAFIAKYLLSDPYILQQHSYSGITLCFKQGFEIAMKKFILQKFLFIVYFLDYAKEKRLIPHDPCLFCKNAAYKESRDILIKFSRELLSGIGDITKHLKNIGYIVKHKQTYLHEYNYAVISLGSDLRDGVRLTRVMEIIMQMQNLLSKLRTPAISKFQKIHNVDVALKALQSTGFVLEGKITPKDIAEGHKEKTLSLLWQIIYQFQAPHFNAAARKIQLWWHKSSLKVEIKRRIRLRKELEAGRRKACIILQKNWRRFAAERHYQCIRRAIISIQRYWRNAQLTKQLQFLYTKKVNTVIKLQTYCRGYLQRNRLKKLKKNNAALKILQWYRHKRAQRKLNVVISLYENYRKERIKRLQAEATIQAWLYRIIVLKRFYKVCEQAVTAHRLQIHTESMKIKAAVVIQSHYRKMVCKRQYNLIYASTLAIQRKWKATLLMKDQRNIFQRIQISSVAIQAAWRGYQVRKSITRQLAAILKIQQWMRATLLMINVRKQYQKKRVAIIKIQVWFKITRVMLHQKHDYQTKRIASVKIQQWFRTMQLMLSQKHLYQEQRAAAMKIQQWYRCTKWMEMVKHNYQSQRAAAIRIQQWFRATESMLSQKHQYQEQRAAAMKIQQWYRCSKQMEMEKHNYQSQRAAAIRIQQWFRATESMLSQKHQYQEQRAAAMKIQQWYRCSKQMEMEKHNYQNQRAAAIRIQQWFRATESMLSQKHQYQEQRAAAMKIQQWYRCSKQMEMEKHNYQSQRAAAIIIQQWFRATESMLSQKHQYQEQRAAAMKIQQWYRCSKQMEMEKHNYQSQRAAAIRIQQWFRATESMLSQKHQYQEQRAAAMKIQQWYRCSKQMEMEKHNYQSQRAAAIRIQQWFRAMESMLSQKHQYQEQRAAAMKIQQWYRCSKQMEMEKHNYQSQRAAAIRIQQWFRATESMLSQKHQYQEQRAAAMKIQQWYRCSKQMELEKHNYQSQRAAAIRIQQWFRSSSLRIEREKHHHCQVTAALKIQRWFRVMQSVKEREDSAAKKIQALWRGYYTRKYSEKGLQCLSKGSLKRENTLIERYNSAVLVLQPTYSFGTLLLAVQVLDTVTRLSRELTEEFANSIHVTKLLQIISSSNRSVPAGDILLYATSIIMNLVKHSSCVEDMWKMNIVPLILNLMINWSCNKPSLFCNCCSIIWLLAEDPQKSVAIAQLEHAQSRLLKCYLQHKIKYKSFGKISNNSTKCQLPDITPEWKINKRKRPRTFQDPYFAIISVLKKLNISTKALNKK